MSSFSGARSKLKNATQDLFRLPGQSIPVDTRSLAPEQVVTSAKPPEAPPASARKAEASIMFSLEELMKAAGPVEPKADDAPDQLWSMQAATPLFGTAHDEALLTTPMKTETGSGMDSMTMPSHPPPGRRWLPMVVAIGGCSLAVTAAAWWAFRPTFADPAPAQQVAAAALSDLPASAASPPTELPPPEAAPAAVVAAPVEPSAEAPVDPAPDVSAEAAVTTPTPSKGPSASPAGTKKKPAAPSSTKSGPFDKAAAKNALNSAASKAAGCRQTGAGGAGKIQLTFAPTGKVTSAQIVQGPSASTAEGKCALRHFRAARIPAFSGAPVTVAKSFKIP